MQPVHILEFLKRWVYEKMLIHYSMQKVLQPKQILDSLNRLAQWLDKLSFVEKIKSFSKKIVSSKVDWYTTLWGLLRKVTKSTPWGFFDKSDTIPAESWVGLELLTLRSGDKPSTMVTGHWSWPPTGTVKLMKKPFSC